MRWDLRSTASGTCSPRFPKRNLRAYLETERLSVATYILSRVDSATAGKVIACLSREMRNDLFCGLISPPILPEAAVAVLEETLREELVTASSQPPAGAQRARVAQLLNGLDDADVDDVMRRLNEVKPEDAKILQSMLFSFNDLPRLSQRAAGASVRQGGSRHGHPVAARRRRGVP